MLRCALLWCAVLRLLQLLPGLPLIVSPTCLGCMLACRPAVAAAEAIAELDSLQELALLNAATAGEEATGFTAPPHSVAALLRGVGAGLPRLRRLELRPFGASVPLPAGQLLRPWAPEEVAVELAALAAAGMEVVY